MRLLCNNCSHNKLNPLCYTHYCYGSFRLCGWLRMSFKLQEMLELQRTIALHSQRLPSRLLPQRWHLHRFVSYYCLISYLLEFTDSNREFYVLTARDETWWHLVHEVWLSDTYKVCVLCKRECERKKKTNYKDHVTYANKINVIPV